MDLKLAVSILASVMLLPVAQESLGGERITVRTNRGRVFTGAVHRDSNRQTLRLEVDGVSVKLVRPIRWAIVREVAVGNQPPIKPEVAIPQLAALKAVRHAGRSVRLADTQRGSYAQQALDLLGF